MPRSLLVGVLIAGLLGAFVAGRSADEERTVAPRQAAPTGLEAHLAALQRIADENGGTRGTGTPGERATGAYIRGRLEAAGYRVRVEQIEIPTFKERVPPRLRAKRAYELQTLRFSGSGAVSGTVRDAKRGCTRARFADVRRGDIALIARGSCSFRAKALAAQRAGAAAVLISDDTTIPGSLQRPGVRIPVVSVDRDGAGLDGQRVRLVVRATSTIERSPNVIAERGDAGAARVVMGGGHLDSVPAGPGLNDNGSGVAALLDIAERLSTRGLPAGTALRFGFWGAEEIGLVGSRQYVAGLSTEERRRIAAYINLDMVGSPGASVGVYQDDPGIERALRRQLPADAPGRTLGGASDHASFNEVGIAVGGLFTGLDDCYHTRCDTIRNVDRAVLGTATEAAHGALVELAGMQ